MRRVGGRAHHGARFDPPAGDVAAPRGRAALQPAPCGLLAVEVAEQNARAVGAARQVNCQMGRQRALAAATLAIDHRDDCHDVPDPKESHRENNGAIVDRAAQSGCRADARPRSA